MAGMVADGLLRRARWTVLASPLVACLLFSPHAFDIGDSWPSRGRRLAFVLVAAGPLVAVLAGMRRRQPFNWPSALIAPAILVSWMIAQELFPIAR